MGMDCANASEVKTGTEMRCPLGSNVNFSQGLSVMLSVRIIQVGHGAAPIGRSGYMTSVWNEPGKLDVMHNTLPS